MNLLNTLVSQNLSGGKYKHYFFFWIFVQKKLSYKNKCSWSWPQVSVHLHSVYGALLRVPWHRTVATDQVLYSWKTHISFWVHSPRTGKNSSLIVYRTMQVTWSREVLGVGECFLLLYKRSSKVHVYPNNINWDNQYSMSYLKGIMLIHIIIYFSLEGLLLTPTAT